MVTWNVGALDLPQDQYASSLSVIQDIPFTRREIDIIACLHSGKTNKKIALFLSIAPKTVENHIRNITLKLHDRTQISIIDFIEKSNKFLLIQKHYSNLLAHSIFEAELKKISKLNHREPPTCLIIRSHKQPESMLFSNQLAKHLTLAGIHILTTDPALKPCLTIALQPEIVTKQNYYHFVFEILQALLPSMHLAQNIVNFSNRCANLFDTMVDDKEFKVKKAEHQTSLSFHYWQGRAYDMLIKTAQKKNSFTLTTASIMLFLLGVLCFKGAKTLLAQPTETQKASSTQTQQMATLNPANSEQPVIEWNIPRQDHIFVGRQELLEKLDQQLHTPLIQNSSDVSGLRAHRTSVITACRGLGGVGKTQIAIRYLRHTAHPYTLKAWFYGENVSDLKQQYVAFAKKLGYKGENPEFSSVLPYIKEWLSQHPGWLLAYDNVSNYQEIEDFLPERGGNIIITSRQRNWPNGFKVLDVDVMTKTDALKLVHSITLRDLESEDGRLVEVLLEKLDYLPLAIAQASAYIKNNSITFEKYLTLYDKAEEKMLADKTMPTGTAHIPIAVTWNASLDAMKTDALKENRLPVSGILLTLCSYLNPDNMPKSLLLQWLTTAYPDLTDPKTVLDQSLGELRRYSLITLDSKRDTISVHRVVQAALRHHHRQTNKKTTDQYYPAFTQHWYNYILQAIHQQFADKGPTTKDRLERQERLLPHLEAIISHYDSARMGNRNPHLALVLFDAGDKLIYNGQALLAKTYLEKALSAYGSKRIAETTPIIRKIGLASWLLGDTNQAEALWKKSLRMSEQLSDRDAIAASLNNLAIIRGMLGRLDEQSALLEKALEIYKRCANPDVYSKCATLHSLGNVYVAQGNAKNGIPMIEQAIKILQKEYGVDNLKVGAMLTTLGNAYWISGDAQRAKVHLENGLKIKKQYFDTQHVAIGTTLNNLGNVYLTLGDANQAKLHLEQALQIFERHHGKNHLTVAIILSNLGEVYGKLGEPNQAKELFARSHKIRKDYKVTDRRLNVGTNYGILSDSQHFKTISTTERTSKAEG